MKTVTLFSVILSLVVGTTGCQTAPKPAPHELTEEEQRALFVNGPIVPLEKPKSIDWVEVAELVGGIVIWVPIYALQSLASGNGTGN